MYETLIGVSGVLFNWLYSTGLILVTPLQDLSVLSFVNPFTNAVQMIDLGGFGGIVDLLVGVLPAVASLSMLEICAWLFVVGLPVLLSISILGKLVG